MSQGQYTVIQHGLSCQKHFP